MGEKLKAYCQWSAFTLGLLAVLRDNDVLDENDIRKVYNLAETNTEMLYYFFMNYIRDETKVRKIAKRVRFAAKWLLTQPVSPMIRRECKLIMDQVVEKARTDN